MTTLTIPMFIIITRPKIPKYEKLTFSCKNLEECKNKLIVNFKNNILNKVDYPEDLDIFSSLFWYNDYNMDNNLFDYEIFIDNKWTQPWTLQELYEQVIDIIHKVDIQDSIYNDKNYYDYCSDDEGH